MAINLKTRTAAALTALSNTGKKSSAIAAFLFGEDGWQTSRSNYSITGNNLFGRSMLQNLDENSAVAACLAWSQRNFKQAKLRLCKTNAKGEKEIVTKHAALKMLKQINPFYGLKLFWAGVLADYHLTGNAYGLMIKNANGLGIPIQLWWIPAHLITPRSEVSNSNGWIDYYEYAINGKVFKLAPDDVIHFRNGIDRRNPRQGKAPLLAALEEIMTDEEASRFLASLLGNMATPGTIITPDDPNLDVSETAAENIKEKFDRRFSGNGRGGTMVLNGKFKVEQLGFAPKDLELGTVRHVPEQRIAGCLGIPLEVVGLGAGKETSTYNNLKTALRQAFEQHLIPTWNDFAEELTNVLLREFGEDADSDLFFEFDTTEIAALADDADAKHKRAESALRAGAITLNQFLTETNRQLDQNGDYYLRSGSFFPVLPDVAATAAALGERMPQPVPANIAAKRDAADGLNQKTANRLLPGRVAIKKDEVSGEENGLSDAHEIALRAEQTRLAEELADVFKLLGADAAQLDLSDLDLDDLKIAEAIGVQLFNGQQQLFVDVFAAAHKRIEAEILRYVVNELGIDLDTGAIVEKTAKANAKRVGALIEDIKSQTVSAVRSVIAQSADGVPVDEIIENIAKEISGKAMYPGKHASAYRAAIDAGLSGVEAEQVAETAAANYRARVIAETEVRYAANYQTVETIEASGAETVKIADGADCGWRFHDDDDLADRSTRTISEARKYLIAHPRCQRRILPHKQN